MEEVNIQKNHIGKILAIGIIVLFIGVGIHPAFAIKSNSITNIINKEENPKNFIANTTFWIAFIRGSAEFYFDNEGILWGEGINLWFTGLFFQVPFPDIQKFWFDRVHCKDREQFIVFFYYGFARYNYLLGFGIVGGLENERDTYLDISQEKSRNINNPFSDNFPVLILLLQRFGI